jgi:hemin uptake protein HemP
MEIKHNKKDIIENEIQVKKEDLPIVISLYNDKKYILKMTGNGKLILNKKE